MTEESFNDQGPDLFECPDSLSPQVQSVVSALSDDLEVRDCDAYEVCKRHLESLRALGYEFDFGLDGVPFNLRPTRTN